MLAGDLVLIYESEFGPNVKPSPGFHYQFWKGELQEDVCLLYQVNVVEWLGIRIRKEELPDGR